MELEAGQVVGGRYRLDRRLGKGGMGEVWAATHEVTRRRLALKFLSGPFAPSAESRQRFLREARAASAVEHPNVVAIHDVFELEDGTPLMVMDQLEGETLAARFGREGPLSLEETATLMLPVVSAVGAAHAKGIVHRDLKPDNIFIAREAGSERVKVLDFGVAKLFGAEPSTGLTGSGAMLGTPCYMAPEQASGEGDVDHRADVWAIGVILYEALSGGRPVEGDNLGQVLTRLLRDGIVPIDALVPDLPPDVVALVASLLAKDRADRPADLRAVAAVLSGYSSLEAPSFAAPGSSPIDEAVAQPALISVARPARGNAWAWLAGVALVAGLGALGVRALGGGDPPVNLASSAITPPAALTSLPAPSAIPPPSPSAFLTPSATAPASTRTGVRLVTPAAPSDRPVAAPSPDAAPAPVKSAKPGGLVEDPPF